MKPPPPIERVSPDYPRHLSNVPCPLPRRTRQTHMSIASLSTRPSPPYGRVGVRIVSFEACSDFTHVTARWIAQPPKAAFVTRLRPGQLPNRSARQLPDQSTTLWVDSSSTDDHVYDRVRNFLRKRHKAPGRGTTRFSCEHVYTELSVLCLCRGRERSPACALR